jgi:hypothetical protein
VPSAAGAPAKDASGAQGSKAEQKKKVAASDGTEPAAQPSPSSVPLAPASSSADDEGGGGIPGWVIVIAAALLAATAVWGGWVLYRRRLTANPGGPGH